MSDLFFVHDNLVSYQGLSFKWSQNFWVRSTRKIELTHNLPFDSPKKVSVIKWICWFNFINASQINFQIDWHIRMRWRNKLVVIDKNFIGFNKNLTQRKKLPNKIFPKMSFQIDAIAAAPDWLESALSLFYQLRAPSGKLRVRTLAERSEARWNPSLKVFPSNSVNTKKFLSRKSRFELLPVMTLCDPKNI